MANQHVFYVSNSGSPATGLSPTWSYLKNVDDGTDYSQPSISEIGGGWYKYNLDLDDFDHVVGVIDAGATVTAAAERYISQDLRFTAISETQKANAVVLPVYDEDTLTLNFVTFLLINGQIALDNLTSVTLAMYDEDHNQQFSINTSSFTNGVAILTRNNPTLTKNKGYYIVVTFVTSVASIVGTETFIVLE